MTEAHDLRSGSLRNEAREALYDDGVHAYLAALGGDDVSERVSDALDDFLDAVLAADPDVQVAAMSEHERLRLLLALAKAMPDYSVLPREVDGEGE